MNIIIIGQKRIRGHKDSDYEERLKLKHFYIKNCGLLLDAKIVFHTIGTVLRREGAK